MRRVLGLTFIKYSACNGHVRRSLFQLHNELISLTAEDNNYCILGDGYEIAPFFHAKQPIAKLPRIE